jgi:hypothetical protein
MTHQLCDLPYGDFIQMRLMIAKTTIIVLGTDAKANTATVLIIDPTTCTVQKRINSNIRFTSSFEIFLWIVTTKMVLSPVNNSTGIYFDGINLDGTVTGPVYYIPWSAWSPYIPDNANIKLTIGTAQTITADTFGYVIADMERFNSFSNDSFHLALQFNITNSGDIVWGKAGMTFMSAASLAGRASFALSSTSAALYQLSSVTYTEIQVWKMVDDGSQFLTTKRSPPTEFLYQGPVIHLLEKDYVDTRYLYLIMQSGMVFRAIFLNETYITCTYGATSGLDFVYTASSFTSFPGLIYLIGTYEGGQRFLSFNVTSMKTYGAAETPIQPIVSTFNTKCSI